MPALVVAVSCLFGLSSGVGGMVSGEELAQLGCRCHTELCHERLHALARRCAVRCLLLPSLPPHLTRRLLLLFFFLLLLWLGLFVWLLLLLLWL